MNDKDLLKLLGLKDRSINLLLDNDLQKQVEQMVNERLDQIEKQETERRERFYKEFIQQMNVFQQAVLRYMEQGDNETEIKQMLDIKAENLGFKYSVLAETPALMLKFADCVRWNRA